MKLGGFLLPIILIGCSRSTDTFSVHAPQATSASLELCDRATVLAELEGRFTASRATTCEGAGSIVVRYKERAPVRCEVGYVIPGMSQQFDFEVVGDQCSPVKSASERT